MHKRTWIKILAGAGVLIVIVFAANSILRSIVEKKLRTSLQQFQPYITTDFAKVHVNLFNASVQLDSVHVSYNPELKQQHIHEVNFSTATISDIHFFKLLTAKNFEAGSLQLKQTKIKLDNYLLDKHDTLPVDFFKRINVPFKNVSFNTVEIKDAVILEKKNSKSDTMCTASIELNDLHLPEINAAFSKDSIRFSNIKCDMNDVHYSLSDYYSVYLEKFHLSSKDSVMKINALRLVPLLEKFELDEKTGREADHIEASINAIEISGFDVMHLRQKKFIAKTIKIENAHAYISSDRPLPHNANNQQMPLDYLKQIPFEVTIGELNMNNAVILEKNNNKYDTMCRGSIALNDLHLPATNTTFSNDSVHFSNVNCDLNDVHYKLSNYYSVHLEKFHLSSKDSVMKIDTLKLVPLVGKFELGEKLGRQADHVNASVNTIDISGLDVMHLQQKKFIAKTIEIKNTNVYVFRDRRLPHTRNKQPMPLDYLKRIPFDVNVGELNLDDADVTSEEFPKEGLHTGYIRLYHLSIMMKPFRNHADKNVSSIASNVKASIMNAGDIHATIDLSLLTGDSEIKGAIDNLKLSAMNPSAENLGKFHIESGVLNHLDFQFTATDLKATGQVVGEYHDLVIDRLKLTKDGLKEAKLASFLLHKVIIPKNKDASLDVKKRTGKIDYERDPTRLVTLYYLKSLLNGIRDSFTLGFVLPD
jgi:hypothetical protein